MSIDVLNRLLVASEWAEQVSNRGGIPSRVREAAQGQSYSISQARAAVAELIAAGNRVTAAFRALGEAEGIRQNWNARHECESAMVALDDVLAACKESA